MERALMSLRRLSIFALTMLPLASGAWAADVTPEGAQALETQVRDWITSTLGPDAKVASRPVQATAEGDHYLLTIPIGDAPSDPKVTANARPGDDGRWTIDNIRIPSPLEFKVNMPKPGGPAGVTSPVTYTLTLAQQVSQVLFDPSYATPSTYNSNLQNALITASGQDLQQTSRIDRATSTNILRPGPDGRLDLVVDGALDGYRINSRVGQAPPVDISFGHVRVNGQLSGISRERSTALLQLLVKIGTSMKTTTGTGAGAAPMDPQTFQALLEALANVATGISLDESFEQTTVGVGGMSGSLNRLRAGLGGQTVNGLLNAHVDLAAEGLVLPELGLGNMVQLIPTRLALRPVVSGVPVDGLMRVLRASQNGGQPTPADIQSLFGQGAITAGLESFSIDVAGTGFTGMGRLVMTSPQVFTATAQITATNLDLLQQRVASNPQLAQALPVFIVAKGIGRASGNQIVWDVSFQDNKLLVNGQDLSALAGHGAPPPPPQRPRR
jgi:hypothetical protein